MAFEELDLAHAVQGVRDELLRAAAQGAGSDVAFEVGPIEMEFSVELRKDARVRGGIRALVISAETEAGAGRARTHRVSVTLTPRRTDTHRPLLIAADSEGDPTGLAGAGAP
ncbi:trypco2 family protein [Streptomyces sp. URMC 129]|uniref:trypco2 family protein n=1 Tax=Streptomyces sp. URMC 129 TaxID=3423407 RepID=UPI003F198A2D